MAATSEAAAPPSDPPPRASKPSRPGRSRGSSRGSSVASQPVDLQPSHTGASGARLSQRQEQLSSPVDQRSAGSSKDSSRLGTGAPPSGSSLDGPGSQSQARRSRQGAMLDFTAGESVILLAMPQDETGQSSAVGDSRSGSHASDDPVRATVSDSGPRPSPPVGVVEEQQRRLAEAELGASARSGHSLRVPMVQVVSSEGSSTTARSPHESPASSGVNTGAAAGSLGRFRAEATEHRHGSDGPAPPMQPTSARTDDSGGRWAPPVPLASKGLLASGGALKGAQSAPALARGAGEAGGPSPLTHGILRPHGSMSTDALARGMIAEDDSSSSSEAGAQGSQRGTGSRLGGSVASASSRHILATVDALLEEISSDSST